MITTNDKMNETVKETLKMRGDNMSLYALKRIEELEEEVKNRSTLAVGQREQLNAFAKWFIREENINSTRPDTYVDDFLESQ